jgi:hypothetical protein
MDYIIKKVSSFTLEEQAEKGITGIPQDWPVEQYVYLDSIPEGFELISDIDLESLKLNNQALYDAWLQSLRPLPPAPAPQLVKLDTPEDKSGRQVIRIATTNDGWYYSPRSIDFYTSKYGSLYNRKQDGAGIDDGTDLGDAILRFYDASDLELTKAENESDSDFQIRLTSSCVKTTMDFEPLYSIDLYGCKLMLKAAPIDRAYIWAIIAPDIPEHLGGSKAFMGGGMNLSMIAPKVTLYTDGKSSKLIKYDPIYHSGKTRAVVKHSLGEQIGLQIVYEYYRE